MSAAIAIVVAMLLGVVGAGAYAIQEDIVPVKIGEYTNIEMIIPETNNISLTMITEEDIYKEFPSLDGTLFMVPHINDVEYIVFETNASAEIIFEDYKNSLAKEGYVMFYRGTETVYGMDVQYNGYLKGPLSAVGVLVTNDMDGHDTIVGYVAGLSLHMRNMINWFKESRSN